MSLKKIDYLWNSFVYWRYSILYDEIFSELLDVLENETEKFKEYEEFVYPLISPWRRRALIAFSIFSIFFVLLFVVSILKDFIENNISMPIYILLTLTILSFFVSLLVVSKFVNTQKNLNSEQGITKDTFVRDGLIKYLKKNYGTMAHSVVTFLIADTLEMQNQKKSELDKIIKFVTEIPMLIITSFVGYSVGVISEKGFHNNPIFSVTVLLLLFILMCRVINLTFSSIITELPKFKSTSKSSLLSILQDVKYKLLN